MNLLKIGETIVNLETVNYARRTPEMLEIIFSSPGGELVNSLQIGGAAAEKAWKILVSETEYDID